MCDTIHRTGTQDIAVTAELAAIWTGLEQIRGYQWIEVRCSNETAAVLTGFLFHQPELVGYESAYRHFKHFVNKHDLMINPDRALHPMTQRVMELNPAIRSRLRRASPKGDGCCLAAAGRVQLLDQEPSRKPVSHSAECGWPVGMQLPGLECTHTYAQFWRASVQAFASSDDEFSFRRAGCASSLAQSGLEDGMLWEAPNYRCLPFFFPRFTPRVGYALCEALFFTRTAKQWLGYPWLQSTILDLLPVI